MSNAAQPTIDSQAGYYDKRFTNFTYANHLKLTRAVAILDCLGKTNLSHPRIIDLGCGAGWLASILGTFGPTVGVELSPAAVDEARLRYPHVLFEAANVFEWRYEPASFDVVVSQEVLEHVPDQPGYLDICHDLLSPGGYLILTTPNADTLYAMPEKDRLTWTNQPIEDWRTFRELHALLEKKFQIITLTSIIPSFGIKGSYRYANSTKLNSMLDKLGCNDLFNRWRNRHGYGLHLLAVAQKI